MRPFLKWAGGKHRSAKRISRHLPPGNRLIEPFVGAGAIFLSTDYPSYLLADTNNDLIQLFRILKEHGTDFIESCSELFGGKNNTESRYYLLRNEFNRSADPWWRSCCFVYLNRHGYNGLCRYNSDGKFNIPFGRYKNPIFPSAEMEFFAVKAQQAEFVCADFRATLGRAKIGDVVYCDPPFTPLSATANFTKYAPGGFSDQDHMDIVDMVVRLRKNGITSVISNHLTPLTERIYTGADRIEYFDAPRSISCQGGNRTKVAEVLAIFEGSQTANNCNSRLSSTATVL